MLRRSNYNTKGQYIKNSGKWYISKKIVSHIENNFNQEKIKPEGEYQKPMINQDIYTYFKGRWTYTFWTHHGSRITRSNQLYPNLQEISLLENNELAAVTRNLLYETLKSSLEDVSNTANLSDRNTKRSEAPLTNY